VSRRIVPVPTSTVKMSNVPPSRPENAIVGVSHRGHHDGVWL